jgi:hypothetical protein
MDAYEVIANGHKGLINSTERDEEFMDYRARRKEWLANEPKLPDFFIPIEQPKSSRIIELQIGQDGVIDEEQLRAMSNRDGGVGRYFLLKALATINRPARQDEVVKAMLDLNWPTKSKTLPAQKHMLQSLLLKNKEFIEKIGVKVIINETGRRLLAMAEGQASERAEKIFENNGICG